MGDEGIVYVRARCPRCERWRRIAMTPDQYVVYRGGEIPGGLSPSDREGLMTGFCDDCWDEMFKEPPV